MRYTACILLNGGAVLRCRHFEILPIAALKEKLPELVNPSLVFSAEELTSLTFSSREPIAPSFAAAVTAFLTETFPDCISSQDIQVTVSREMEGETAHVPMQEKGGAATPADEVMKEIRSLVGGESFKALAEELLRVVPALLKKNNESVLLHCAYLFSIGDGCGLTTYLTLLQKLLSACGLKCIHTCQPPTELTVPAYKSENGDFFAPIRNKLSMGDRNSVTVLCLDITEWMNGVNTGTFKTLLKELERSMGKYIVVFRIPFVDNEVLDRIKFSLNDLLFVQSVSIPPFTAGELRAIAEKEVERYHFHMTKAAWPYFDSRIGQEKSDGRFYGLKTVAKVIRELIYKKQLADVLGGHDSPHIGATDAQGLSENHHESDLGGMEMLERMVGVEGIRVRINEILAQIQLAKASADDGQSPCIHMRFVGNPGTGKTTVARIIGKILKEQGVLRIGDFHECAGRDLIGRYIGETAPKTASICRDAYGSVLFIDEAYALYRSGDNERDFGREALDTLIAEMENHRSDLVVIMAGYRDEMDHLFKGNPGLASRVPYTVEFPNFTREQLYNIFSGMIRQKFSADDELLLAAKEYFFALPDDFINAKDFSNARFVRNLFERVWAKSSTRNLLERGKTVVLKKEDFTRAIADREFWISTKKAKRIGFLN